MTNFINLTCQRCGGHLVTTAKPGLLRCEHCGQEFLLSSPGPASADGGYASCPLCGRNDRAEKVTTITARDTHNLSGTTVQDTSYRDSKGNWVSRTGSVPFSGTQVSDLAQRLARPTAPEMPSKISLALFRLCQVFYVGAFLYALVWVAATLSGYGDINLAVPLIGLAFSLMCIIVMGREAGKRKRIYAEAKQQYPTETARYQRACAAWDRLYYCHRDDVVFLPGTSQSAPARQMRDLLYRV